MVIPKEVADALLTAGLEVSISESLSFLGKLIHRPKNYNKRLNKIITDTLIEYEKKNQIKEKDGKEVFYHRQDLVIELLKYRLFKNYSIENIKKIIENNPEVLKPTEKQLNDFYILFLKKIKEDKLLKKIFIEENFKEEIFIISSKLDLITEEIITRIKNEFNSDFNGLFSDVLDNIQTNIYEFKPSTAKDWITRFEENIRSKYIINNKQKARLHYLKGVCDRDLFQMESANENFLSAFNLDQGNDDYENQAVLSNFELGQKELASEMADKLIAKNKFNQLAWTIKIHLEKTENLIEFIKNIPQIVKDKKPFKVNLSYELLSRKLKTNELINYGIFWDINSLSIPESFNYQDKYYWIFLATLVEVGLFEDHPIIGIAIKNEELLSDWRFEKLNQITKLIQNTFNNKEVYDLHVKHIFFYFYTTYFITYNKDYVFKLGEIFRKIKNKNDYTSFVINCYCIAKEYDQGIELINDTDLILEPETLLLKSNLLLLKDDLLNSEKSYKEYIDKVGKINDTNLNILLDYFDRFQNTLENRKAFVNELRAKDKFEDSSIENFINIYAFFDDPSLKESIKVQIDSLTNEWGIQKNYRKYIANIYFNLELYKKCMELLADKIDKLKPSPELYLYCESCFQAKEKSQEIIDIIDNWSTHYEPHQRLLQIEIDLLSKIPDWTRIKKTAEIGLKYYPQDENFINFLFHALDRLNEVSQLYLYKDSIAIYQVKDWRIAFQIAGVLIRNKFYNEALRLMYPFAKQKENKAARTVFFINVTSGIPHEFYYKNYSVIEENTAVDFSANNILQTIYLDKVAIDNNPIAKFLITKKLNEECFYQNTLDRSIVNIQILSITDKYSGLLIEIRREVNESAASGIGLQNIEVKNGKPEEFEKALKEKFGIDGDIRKEKREEIIKQYNNYKLGFSEYTNALFQDSFIDSYYHLISNQSDGFRTLPLSLTTNIEWAKHEFLLLDYSSLLLLYELSKKFEYSFPVKFRVSQLIRQDIINKIAEADNRPQSKISLDITSTEVRPFFFPDDFNQKRRSFFSKILDWIDNNCIVEMVPEKLDMVTQFERGSMDNLTMQLMIDNMTLVEKRNYVLITDDLSIYRFFSMLRNNFTSTENFLRSYVNAHFKKDFIFQLLEFRYIGVTITKQELESTFSKSFNLDDSLYQRCLSNLPWLVNPDKNAIMQVIKFTKDIYLKATLNPNDKKRISQTLFLNVLTGFPIDKQKINLIIGVLHKEFEFLQDRVDSVIEDFVSALEILGHHPN